jgi:hypothetical protein
MEAVILDIPEHKRIVALPRGSSEPRSREIKMEVSEVEGGREKGERWSGSVHETKFGKNQEESNAIEH